MDLTTGRTRLKERGFDFLSDAQTDVCLNAAKNYFEDLAPWPWLETVATGTAPLTISDLKQILYVVDTTNDRELTGLDPRDIASINPEVSTTGTPANWWLDGTTSLKLYPTNTTVSLSVRYVKFSPELSSGSDTPLIPTRYHSLWVDFAVVEAHRLVGNLAAADAYLTDLMNRRVGQLLEVYSVRNFQNPAYQNLSHFPAEDW